MTHSPNVCPEGWEAAQLLAYIEGHLEPDAKRDLARHLQECRVCALELESLRRLDSFLKAHPETFHPDDEELYHFASTHADPEGHIAAHLESCSECEESLRAFREMIALRAASPPLLELPQALEREFARIYGTPPSPARGSLIDTVSAFLRKTFSVPILALGTAAAVLILSVLVIPLWRALKEIPPPAAVPPAQEMAETGSEQPLQSPDLEGRISTEKSSDNRQPRQVYPKAEGTRARRLPQPETPAAGTVQGAPESKAEREATSPGAAPLGFMEKERKEPHGPREEAATDKLLETVPMPAREGKLKQKKDQPASAEMPRGSVLPPAKATPHTRIPVRVLITDGEGRPVQWLNFAPDPATEHRYLFVGPAAMKDELSKAERAPESSAPPVEAHQGYAITVRVTESGGTYEIEAKLFPGSVEADGAPSKTVVARNLNKQDVPGRVTFLVGVLLGH